MKEIRFEIAGHLLVLKCSPSGWTKEVNLVAWNDDAPKYDIREWSPGHEKLPL